MDHNSIITLGRAIGEIGILPILAAVVIYQLIAASRLRTKQEEHLEDERHALVERLTTEPEARLHQLGNGGPRASLDEVVARLVRIDQRLERTEGQVAQLACVRQLACAVPPADSPASS